MNFDMSAKRTPQLSTDNCQLSAPTALSTPEATALLQIAASAEAGSEHPLGQAIVQDARDKNIKLLKTDSFNSITGDDSNSTASTAVTTE